MLVDDGGQSLHRVASLCVRLQVDCAGEAARSYSGQSFLGRSEAYDLDLSSGFCRRLRCPEPQLISTCRDDRDMWVSGQRLGRPADCLITGEAVDCENERGGVVLPDGDLESLGRLDAVIRLEVR